MDSKFEHGAIWMTSPHAFKPLDLVREAFGRTSARVNGAHRALLGQYTHDSDHAIRFRQADHHMMLSIAALHCCSTCAVGIPFEKHYGSVYHDKAWAAQRQHSDTKL